mgnify:FL=1
MDQNNKPKNPKTTTNPYIETEAGFSDEDEEEYDEAEEGEFDSWLDDEEDEGY